MLENSLTLPPTLAGVWEHTQKYIKWKYPFTQPLKMASTGRYDNCIIYTGGPNPLDYLLR